MIGISQQYLASNIDQKITKILQKFSKVSKFWNVYTATLVKSVPQLANILTVILSKTTLYE